MANTQPPSSLFATQGQAVDAAIASLRAVIPTRILAVRGTALYDERNDSYLAAQVSEVKPVLIFLPTSKEQVALFIKIIKPFAVVGIVRFAIRGAVAAGEIWGNVYSKLEGTGYGVGGSRSGLGGIGGLATQGGLSFFSSREGLIADNVLNYEIVLAFPGQIDALVGEIKKPNPSPETQLMISIGYSSQLGDAATLKAASTYYTTAISTITSVTDLLGSLTLQPYPLSLLNQQAPNGGNVLGLDPSSGPLVSILLLTYWSNPADDALVYTTMKSVLDKINADATARKTLVPFKFMNYATKSDDVISSYGATNKAKLQKASKKYDPQGLFQTGVPDYYKRSFGVIPYI
ncbi:hypothetical protein M7I_4621 [Glarea lozoyensis 74030]|uniref:FAD linked oxidase N-terminal domain-containing protein n=1 Tax=Glarea lozoyensis (strain ATCC 74030 / MF5533) TaxID=1104152 RepID=H0EPN6_GLAL7|nr:hypothetical protein M7I_4621 [Glarea lozoyensis 74030]